jgi:hypothetical protein
LGDIREIFDVEADDVLLSRVLIEALVADAEKPWAQFYKGKPLSPNRLAKMLRTFGIISEEIHAAGDNRLHGRGYKRVRFEEAWERFLPENPLSKPVYPSNTDKTDTSRISKPVYRTNSARFENDD